MNNNINSEDYRFFSFFSLFWLALGWLGFLLALEGYCSFWNVLLSGGIITGVFIFLFFRRKWYRHLSKEFLIYATILLIFSVIISFFATPSIFSGRDQGSISEAAIRLAQNHHLEFSSSESDAFFKIYGPGRALNFPGFYYLSNGHLITQFPLVYISWLAMFYVLFGLSGMIIANIILLFVFSLAFYLLLRVFSEKKLGFILVLAIISSFVFSWFFKFTLSENIAIALLWVGILGLVQFLKKPEKINYILVLLAFGLLFFARLEGIAFLIVVLALIFIFSRRSEFWKTNKREKLFFPVLIFLFVFGSNLNADFYFYKEIGKTLFGSSTTLLQQSLRLSGYLSSLSYTLKIFSLYGLIIYLLIGLSGIIYFLKNKKWELLVPFFVVAPSFIYLINPNISADHPWMLRRFVFAIVPVLILYTFLFLEHLLAGKKRIWFWVISASILLINFYPFAKFLTFSENRGLLESTQKLSQDFSSNDLVLVDRLASGDGWSIPTGPLSFMFGKKAVYFFNPNDLPKLNLESFDRIYLVVSNDNVSFFENSIIGKRLINPKSYSLNVSRLDTNEMIRLPQKETSEITGKIFEITK